MTVRELGSIFGLVLLPMLALSACNEEKKQDKDSDKKEAPKKVELSAEEKKAILEHSKALEVFTGSRTRVVWTSQEKEDKADPFVVGNSNILRGLDSGDGMGVRTLISKRGNYARPLLNHDGTVILFTDKGIKKKDDNKKHYNPVIYRLGWDDAEPKAVAEGYAMDTWVDPKTGIEWVYAARELVPSTRIAIEARKLVRFPLNEPEKVEELYDETPIGTDNFQLSRDGTRASGLFPWPHCGVFRIEDGQWEPVKRLTGCWPSMAPDNSGVAWVFDGPHRNGYFFADDKRAHWVVPFNSNENMNKAEVYHPRWSNHARYVAITGPYIKDKNDKGSVIGKGGSSADVYVARLDERATKIEAWFRINEDQRGDSYPDVWIDGGENSNLVGYGIVKENKPIESAIWPVVQEGRLLLWKDRTALNSFKTRDGKKLETQVIGNLAARYGRFNELLLDGGWYEVEDESAEPLLQHLKEGKDATIEMLIYPGKEAGNGTLLSGEGLKLAWKDGALTIQDGATRVQSSAKLIQDSALHLLVTRRDGKWQAYVNGTASELVTAEGNEATKEGKLTFGGDWDAGLQRIGVYDTALTAEEIEKSVSSAQAYLAQLPPPAPRVKLRAKLVEDSAMPTPEGIDPYRNALVAYAYEVEEVLSGEFKEEEVLVKHWAMLGLEEVMGFPREIGKSYELVLEKAEDHPNLNGERVMDDTVAGYTMEAWFDVTPPRVMTREK